MGVVDQVPAQSVSLPLPPGPPGMPFFGHVFRAWKDPLALMTSGHRAHGDVTAFYFGPLRYFLVNDPDAVHRVLLENRDNYTKSRNYRGLKLVLGEGLLTSEGEFWRRQRKLAQPAFHRESLERFARAMSRITREHLDAWKARPEGTVVDIHREMTALTFRIVGHTLCHTELGDETSELGEAITVCMKHANDYAEAIVRVPPWVPTYENLRFKRALSKLDAMIRRIIEERRAAVARRGSDEAREHDLLQMLMDATDDAGVEHMTDQQLRDELLTLVLAGHETTANALSFAFHLLSRHPDVARRAADEARTVLAGGELTMDRLKELAFVGRVFDEALRLYPPAWIFERQAIGDDELAGFRVPSGTIVGIAPWTLHRNPKLWENPEGFDPDRFLPERRQSQSRYAYLPFGGGPRVCIGNQFALMEAKIILAHVLAEHRLDLVPGERLELDPGITLRPRGGLHMALRREEK